MLSSFFHVKILRVIFQRVINNTIPIEAFKNFNRRIIWSIKNLGKKEL